MTKLKKKSRQKIEAPLQEQSGPVSRMHQTWSTGDCAHQGDLIFVSLGERLPTSARLRSNRQLADGVTQGSRHVLEGGQCFDVDAAEVRALVRQATVGKVDPSEQCCGPIFTGGSTVLHPQHQHQGFPADTVTACISQRNLDAEEREIRARD